MESRHYAPTLPYNNKDLAKSHRHVSPTIPIGTLEEGSTFTIPASKSTASKSPRYGNPTFIRLLGSICGEKRVNVAYQWQYDMRWQAQSILPFLYLGPSSSARDQSFLKQAGITLLVAVRQATAARARPSFLNPAPIAAQLGIAAMTLDIDSPYELRSRLASSIKSINDHLEQSCTGHLASTLDDVKGRVLVYCESGSERSPILIAAYLMVVCGLDAISSLQVIQSQRFCLSPTDSMKEMLLNLEDYLDAEQDVLATRTTEAQIDIHNSTVVNGQPSFARLNKPRKRDIDESYDDGDIDQNMLDVTEAEGDVDRRLGQAPFADVN